MTHAARRRASGFSLLELVVALAIMAFALGGLYRAVGGGVRAVGDASQYTRAIAFAESVLQANATVPAGGWKDSGVWDRYYWSISTSPLDAGTNEGVRLHRIQVDITWVDGQRERSFSLVSIRPQQVDVPSAR